MCPVPGQGLICFKCGKSHRASECSFSGTCNTCGKKGHISVVCKRNPNCIIKWQCSGSSSAGSTSVASSRGSAPTVAAPCGTVQMMAGPPPAPYSSCPQYYYRPPGYYWPPPQLPTPRAPLQLPALPSPTAQLPQYAAGGSSSTAPTGVYTMPTAVGVS